MNRLTASLSALALSAPVLASTPVASAQVTAPNVASANVAPSASSAPAAAPASRPAAVLRITASRLPGGEATRAYRAVLRATGGVAPLYWSRPAGRLPAGLTMSRSGVISGRITKAGVGRFTVRVRDARGRIATKSVQLPVVPYGGLVLSPTKVGPAVLGSTPAATVKAISAYLGTPTATKSGIGCELIGPQVSYWAKWGNLVVYGAVDKGRRLVIDSWMWHGPASPRSARTTASAWAPP